MKKIGIFFCLLLMIFQMQAQVQLTQSSLTYFQDFNSLDTSVSNSHTALPEGWSIAEHGTSANGKYRGGAGTLTTNDVYSFGVDNSNERSLGSIGGGTVDTLYYGMQFQNNVGADISLANITFKEEQWRSGDTGTAYIDTVQFFYTFIADSLNDAAANWIEVPSLMMRSIVLDIKASTLNGDSVATVISSDIDITIPAGSKLWIRWRDWNSRGSDDALSIDSLTVTFGTLRPIVVAKTPANNTTHLELPTTVSLTFDQPVLKGSGSIYIKNETDNHLQILSASSGSVAVNGNEVILNGVDLISTRTYHITFDSTAFFSLSNYSSFGITDTSSWRFSTIDPATGIHDVSNNRAGLTVLGDATNSGIQLMYNLTQNASVQFFLSDMSGRLVYSSIAKGKEGRNTIQLSPGNIGNGMYVIRLISGGNTGYAKCMIR